MKKIATIILILAVLLTFYACKGVGEDYTLELSFDEITYFSVDTSRAVKLSSTDTFIYAKTDSGKDIYWESSDASVIALGEQKTNGIYLKTLKTGIATISASVKGTTLKVSVTFTVSPTLGDMLSLSPSSITEAYIGYERKLGCLLDNITISNELVSFSSSSPDTVSVDESGQIKVLKTGSATITASYSGLSAYCTVTTNQSSPRFWLSEDSIVLNVSQTYDIVSGISMDTDYVTSTPSFYFQSSNVSVVSISANGIATAQVYGTVSVCITNSYNNEVLYLAITVE